MEVKCERDTTRIFNSLRSLGHLFLLSHLLFLVL